jgi:plastocyanin
MIAAALTACVSERVSTGPAAPATDTVLVGNGSQLVFVPASLTIPVGATVLWVWNSGIIPHNVTTSNGSPMIPGTPSGTSATPATFGPVQFTTPGTYRYYCSVHAGPNDVTGMVGTITVQ